MLIEAVTVVLSVTLPGTVIRKEFRAAATTVPLKVADGPLSGPLVSLQVML